MSTALALVGVLALAHAQQQQQQSIFLPPASLDGVGSFFQIKEPQLPSLVVIPATPFKMAPIPSCYFSNTCLPALSGPYGPYSITISSAASLSAPLLALLVAAFWAVFRAVL